MIHNHTRGHVRASFLVSSDNAEVELQGISERCHPLCAAGILGYDNALFPVGHIKTDPPCNQRLGMEVIDRALEETLHLGGVEIDGDDVFDAGDVH
jgi:hypothetical protein